MDTCKALPEMHKIYRKSNKTKSGVHFLHMNNFVPREKQHSFNVSSARNSTASSKSERGEKSVRTVEVCSHLPLLTEQTTNSNRYKCVIHMCMHLFTTSSTISYREKHVPSWNPHSSYTSTGGTAREPPPLYMGPLCGRGSVPWGGGIAFVYHWAKSPHSVPCALIECFEHQPHSFVTHCLYLCISGTY